MAQRPPDDPPWLDRAKYELELDEHFEAPRLDEQVRARALAEPATLCAFWLIGFEDAPERSAEICLMEVFGRDVGARTTRVGLGIHPFGDPTIDDDFEKVEIPIDAREPHTYSAEWLPDRVRFYIDDDLVKVVRQSPAYPMQLMLNIYEFAADETARDPGGYPKAFEVDWVRGWRPRS
jgi:beta-glucanase (GH16 family)